MLERLTIASRPDVAGARQQARAEALLAGLSVERAAEVAIVATELATNILKYAGSGHILAQAMPQPEGTALALVAWDEGPGIANLEQMRRDRVSGGGSAGIGIGAIERLSDRAEVVTGPGGTTWACSFDGAGVVRPQGLDIAGLRLAHPSEQVCGDAWGAMAHRGGVRLVLADGMGHGTSAAEAGQAMVDLALAPPVTPPKRRLVQIIDALSRSRGGVMSMLDLQPDRQLVAYGNLGNISGFYLRHGVQKRLASRDGFVGNPTGRPMEEELELAPGDVFILHSDGLRTVAPETALGATQYSALMMAALLLSDAQRHRRDDIAVAIARFMPAG